ncbi:MAG: hypothetical protein MJE68_01190, partial [Proteobacteria bacterium]|nr:hypothetical protein [Pseudomonadota bacterium]
PMFNTEKTGELIFLRTYHLFLLVKFSRAAQESLMGGVQTPRIVNYYCAIDSEALGRVGGVWRETN